MQLLGAKNEKWLPSVIWKFGPHWDQNLTLGPKTALKWRREAKDGPNAPHLVYLTCFGRKKKILIWSFQILSSWRGTAHKHQAHVNAGFGANFLMRRCLAHTPD